ncbi:MAG TPA: molybdopterin biosynthesis protein [Candidatus Methanoperedenaceae archaeon]|nr:molybdopterin biosynthesis protein [Candidatus Methanoperedenaceae archaeon]
MMRKEFRQLIPAETARKLIDDIPIEPRVEAVPLELASGRILAEDVHADVDVPPFDRASVDGYALRSADTYRAREDMPAELVCTGSVPVGRSSVMRVEAGEAVEIATGAPMPAGADAVVMVEHTHASGGRVFVKRPVKINQNVMQAGSDIMVGEKVLRMGALLSAREIGVLAAVGRKSVSVRALRAGIISTGDEISVPGEPLPPGKIYDINSYSLHSALLDCRVTPVLYGIAGDTEKKIREQLARAAGECDVILTSGSTSAGAGDMMYRLLDTVLFHGIDMKPGKPALAGTFHGKPVFALPGYPSSALTIFNEFIAPKLRNGMGYGSLRKSARARLAAGVRTGGRRFLMPVGLVRGRAYPVEKESGAITALAEADGFVDIPGTTELLLPGDEVDVTLYGDIRVPDLLFVGSHCLGVELLADVMGLNMRIINAGSSGGFSAIKNGTADIAGVHMLDESGGYNLPFIERFGLEDTALVKGYLREQGLMVRKNSDIRGFEDLPGKIIINRNRGSGTRLLTDMKLREAAAGLGMSFEELRSRIGGYETEAKTHSAVASAVKLGRADAGIGIRSVAEMNGLGFIKIADEEYDFLIPEKLLGKDVIKRFLEALGSDEFAKSLPVGLRVYERTGEIILP